MTVKLSPSLPKEWMDNGLDRMQSALLADPLAPQVIIAVVRPVSVTRDIGSGLHDVKIQVCRTEACIDPDTRDRILTELMTINDQRCDKQPLPIEPAKQEEQAGGAKLFDLRTGTGFHPSGAAGGGA